MTKTIPVQVEGSAVFGGLGRLPSEEEAVDLVARLFASAEQPLIDGTSRFRIDVTDFGSVTPEWVQDDRVKIAFVVDVMVDLRLTLRDGVAQLTEEAR